MIYKQGHYCPKTHSNIEIYTSLTVAADHSGIVLLLLLFLYNKLFLWLTFFLTQEELHYKI